jgi:hypothetical protein
VRNALKRRVGRCQNANCKGGGLAKGRCTAGFEVCFDWDHVVEALKGRCVSQICHETRTRPEAEWKAEIYAEVAKCRLLCRNCHHERSNGAGIVERALSDYESDGESNEDSA